MSKYYDFLIVCDFNSETSETSTCNFCDMYDLHYLVKNSICYKNPRKPLYTDLYLTQTLEKDLSDFHKLTFTVLLHFEKPKPKIVVYRDCKNFSNERFRLDFLSDRKISSLLIQRFLSWIY